VYPEKVLTEITNYKKVYRMIRKSAIEYVRDSGVQSLVLGISGGIDSTLVAMLAREVCDEVGIPLLGRNIMIRPENAGGNGWEGNTVAMAVGENLCDDFQVIDRSEVFKTMWAALDGDLYVDDETEIQFKIRRGNAMARLRMVELYDLAQKNKGLVLSTDNMTEYLLGFWTLHGDVGDYGMIQQLWKTEVYALTDWLLQENPYSNEDINLAVRKSYDKTPTDGLGVSSSDFAQLGANSYEEIDFTLKKYIQYTQSQYWNKDCFNELNANPVVIRHKESSFKRSNPFNIPRTKYI